MSSPPSEKDAGAKDAGVLAARFLDVIENDIVPKTRDGVAAGNKLFGAAILKKSDLSLVVADVNQETANPLFHGEVSTLNSYYRLPVESRPPTAECLFLSTHEPCPLCLAAITWAGFDNFTYLFAYEDTRDAFAIPHDLKILEEVFGVPDGGYRHRNAFWESQSLAELVKRTSDAERATLTARIDALGKTYSDLSAAYQAQKGSADIPLS